MRKIHVVAVLLYLVAMTNCRIQESETNNVTYVESTTEEIKKIDKRHALGTTIGASTGASIGASIGTSAGASIGTSAGATTGVTNAPVQDNILGLGSVGIQVLGGLFQNMLNTHGVNAQVIGSVINLFKPEKIRSDLLLIRRVFNLLARSGVVLNRYLPTPPSSGYSFSPLDLLSSKVKLYTPQTRDGVQWIAKDKRQKSKALLKVPPRVQMMVDYVTQRPLVTSTTNKLEPSKVLETNQHVDVEIQKVVETPQEVDVTNDNINVEEKETGISTNTSKSFPPQNTGSINVAVTGEHVVKETPQLEYGLPVIQNKPEDASKTNDLLLTENEIVKTTSAETPSKVDGNSIPGYELSTTSKPNGAEIVSNKLQIVEEYGLPPANNSLERDRHEHGISSPNLLSGKHPYLEYGLPAEESKPEKVFIEEGAQVYDLLLSANKNKDKSNEITEEYGLPLPSPSTATNENQRFEEYGLPAPNKNSITFRPIIHQQYGVPNHQLNNNILSRRRDKTGLPLQHVGQVFAGSPHFEGGFLHQTGIETNSFANIADVPLERHTIFDTRRRHGPLRDSFGFPVRN